MAGSRARARSAPKRRLALALAGVIALLGIFASDSVNQASAEAPPPVTLCLNGETITLPANQVYDANGTLLPAYKAATIGPCPTATGAAVPILPAVSPTIA